MSRVADILSLYFYFVKKFKVKGVYLSIYKAAVMAASSWFYKREKVAEAIHWVSAVLSKYVGLTLTKSLN